MEEPEELQALIHSLVAISRRLAEWEAQATLARERAVARGVDVEDAAQLARFRAMRACCEVALDCAEGETLVARQEARAATSQVDAWYELEKQVRAQQR
jgi:hypothetical protein